LVYNENNKCISVENTMDDDASKKDLFLCRNNFDRSYVLTNKDDFEVLI